MESKEHISYRMKRVKSKDSKIELMLRKALWQKGFRYRKHYNKIIGCPDIVFPAKKIAIFCDSEFWHGYDWVNYKKHAFKSNKEFWINKIECNIARDKEVNEFLAMNGWTVLRFWGKDIQKNIQDCVERIEEVLNVGG